MNTPQTPMEFARRARTLYGLKEAVVDGDGRWTFSEFFNRCDRWSTALAGLGVEQGDRVAYIAPNTHRHLEGYYAVPQLGAVIVPLNYRLLPSDWVYMLNHSGTRVLCVHEDYLEQIEGVRDQLPKVESFISLDGPREGWLSYEELLTATQPDVPPVEIAEDDLLAINYTSGTTSDPKGVMITHRNAWVNVVGTLLHHPMTSADRYLWTLPMFHANGWTFVWIVTAIGGRHVCAPNVAPETVFGLAKQEGVTMLCAAPTVLIMIANAPEELRATAPTGVRVLTAGAAPAAHTIGRVEDDLGWTVTHVYGLTETSPLISICEMRPEHAALSTEERARHKARQGVEMATSGELRVVDEAGNDVPWDGETVGEIVVRGNVVMKGYYRDPEATAKAFEGGFFHTGDAAVVEPDGYMLIQDRIKDVIISGGENISSVEVEGVLLEHPAIQEVAVVGLPHETWGEAPHAFCLLQPDTMLDFDELRVFARERLAGFKVPKGMTVLEELPKTATGKIQKYVLRGGGGVHAQ
ncbi:MAG: long-chain-fatty-acid--CoA ligase [Gemmatimonadota bacterium]|nr:long-chain-fatty-acid--CoA ligase [Gemmatimonadota bacterium]MDE3006870.1 long-chain-fatty-acid--CoA ligase [Gemmatimonadota bacterium]MDE3014425.1 long-chain-fatty-acid--CoA ligase [Gemmatimonadota bacterium]